jgi:hypothetical protein
MKMNVEVKVGDATYSAPCGCPEGWSSSRVPESHFWRCPVRFRQLEGQLAEARAVLRKLEWMPAGEDYVGAPMMGCPICKAFAEDGHGPDCRLENALKAKP